VVGLGRGDVVGLAGFRQLHGRISLSAEHDAEVNIVVGDTGKASVEGSTDSGEAGGQGGLEEPDFLVSANFTFLCATSRILAHIHVAADILLKVILDFGGDEGHVTGADTLGADVAAGVELLVEGLRVSLAERTDDLVQRGAVDLAVDGAAATSTESADAVSGVEHLGASGDASPVNTLDGLSHVLSVTLDVFAVGILERGEANNIRQAADVAILRQGHGHIGGGGVHIARNHAFSNALDGAGDEASRGGQTLIAPELDHIRVLGGERFLATEAAGQDLGLCNRKASAVDKYAKIGMVRSGVSSHCEASLKEDPTRCRVSEGRH